MVVNLALIAKELEKMFKNKEIDGYVLINGKPEVVLTKDSTTASKLASLLKDLPDKEKIIKLVKASK